MPRHPSTATAADVRIRLECPGSPDNVEETVEAMFSASEPSMAEVARTQAADRRLAEAEKKLTRFK